MPEPMLVPLATPAVPSHSLPVRAVPSALPALPTLPSGLAGLLAPFTLAVTLVLDRAHQLLLAVGLGPGSGLLWPAAIALLVVAVRLALVPLVVRQVRLAHAAARARPDLERVRRRYAGRTDADSLRAQLAELRAVRAAHGTGAAAAAAPLLLQVPLLVALFHVLRDVGDGVAVGALGAAVVVSAGTASLFGVSGAHLGATLTRLGPSPAALLVVGLGVAGAVVTYLSTRYLTLANLPPEAFEGPVGAVQHLMPALAATGLLVSAAMLPLGLVLYTLVGALWAAGQQAVVNRWAPTPGSAAHARRTARS